MKNTIFKSTNICIIKLDSDICAYTNNKCEPDVLCSLRRAAKITVCPICGTPHLDSEGVYKCVCLTVPFNSNIFGVDITSEGEKLNVEVHQKDNS